MPTIKIKPFGKPGFTPFDNVILDYIMPRLSPAAWKILCIAIRQTWGYAEEGGLQDRREEAMIAYSTFQRKSGIKSSATIRRAIKECLDKQYLLRRPSDVHSQSFCYRLNTSLEIEVVKTALEIKEVTSSKIKEVGTETTSKVEDIEIKQQKEKQQQKDDVVASHSQSNNKLPDTETAYKSLRAIGVIKAVARKLSQSHPPARVMIVASAAADKERPAGWARRALEGSWEVADPAKAKEDELRLKAKRCARDMVKPCPLAAAGHSYSYCQFCEWREAYDGAH